MEDLKQSLDTAVPANDYSTITGAFGAGPSSWASLGQGEQRSLAAHFITLAIASPTFLPGAFASEPMMECMLETLKNLPTTVPGAADNKLRRKIYDYKVNAEGGFSNAARILAGMRMEDDPNSVYFTSPADQCDVYVNIAECFLEDDEIVESDGAVTKAGTVVEGITDPDNHMALILRYKSTYARVLDANRKFLQAAGRYHDLSQSSSELIRAEDLLSMLGRAATCAILAPSGAQRKRVLGHIYKDDRLSQLDSIPDFETHSTILKKMFKDQILEKEELVKFESSLQDHQKATMGDGLTIMERGVVEHNMIAVSKIYQSILISELGLILGVTPDKAEHIAANMMMDGSVSGSIDQVEGLVEFDSDDDSPDAAWNESITNFCVELNRITESIEAQ